MSLRTLISVVVLLVLLPLVAAGRKKLVPVPPPSVVDAREAAARIAGTELTDGQAYAILQSLTDRVGARLAGTPGAERAVEWALAKMREVGLENVRREPVKVPRWVRGTLEAEVMAPVPHPLHAVALGGSVGTPAEGITAEVVEVGSFDELKALGERARGKVVLFNKQMTRSATFSGYGEVVPLRGRGAVEAARLGAVAALVRSVGTGAFRLPHTGTLRYDPKVSAIPALALAAEDADLIHRLLEGGGPVTLRLRVGARLEGEVESANVVGELRGRERPEEVMLIGAHLDSWDLGTGAVDDGAGCAIVLETARLIKRLGLVPRRTLRVVLFMNEEFGLDGARAYAQAHAAEAERHVGAMEADAGGGKPLGVVVNGGEAQLAAVRAMAAPLAAFGVTEVLSRAEAGGADLRPLDGKGIPFLSVMQDVSSYFDWHHTAADTLDKVDAGELRLATLAFAVMAHAVADAPMRLPPVPSKR